MGLFNSVKKVLGWDYLKRKIEDPVENEFGRKSNITGTQKKFIKPLQKDLKGANKTGIEQLLELLNMQPEDITGDYETFSKPLLEQWETDIMPSILERFSDSKSSGALNRALAQGGRGVQQDLSTLYANLNQQNKWNTINTKQNALSSLLGYNQFAGNPNQISNYSQPGQPNWVQTLAPYLVKGGISYATGGGGGLG